MTVRHIGSFTVCPILRGPCPDDCGDGQICARTTSAAEAIVKIRAYARKRIEQCRRDEQSFSDVSMRNPSVVPLEAAAERRAWQAVLEITMTCNVPDDPELHK